MAILSFQSHVATGRVGNAIVAFALQRLGIEVWPIHTVLFSNHPGHGPFRGKRRAPKDLTEIILGLEDHGVFSRCKAVLGGYLGSAASGAVLLDAVSRIRTKSPDVDFFLDPVMGDEGKGLYVPDELVEFYRHATEEADVIAPNAFELGVLTDRKIASPADGFEAARTLLRGRTRTVLVTSVPGFEPDVLVTLSVDAREARAVVTPKLALDPKGAGDLFMALAAAHTLRTGNPAVAVQMAVSTVWSLTEAAIESPDEGGDLPIVTRQSLLRDPMVSFKCDVFVAGDDVA
ncbi:MAG: pyridoxal kinase [Rhodospirillales bacterium]